MHCYLHSSDFVSGAGRNIKLNHDLVNLGYTAACALEHSCISTEYDNIDTASQKARKKRQRKKKKKGMRWYVRKINEGETQLQDKKFSTKGKTQVIRCVSRKRRRDESQLAEWFPLQ